MELNEPDSVDRLFKYTDEALLHGVVLNAGGPPTGTPLKTTMSQWDEAYQLVMRWKIELATRLAPVLAEHNYGRMLFIESQSVKQPLPSLVLSKDRKSTRLNSSHVAISYAVFCLKKKKLLTVS